MCAWRRVLGSKAFTRYLLLTNVIISGATPLCGDLLEQRIEGDWPNDWPRTWRMTLVGLLFGAPDHYWYKLLDWKLPGRSGRIVAAKVVLDMCIMGPFSIVGFYCAMCTLEGKSLQETKSEVKQKFLPTFKLELVVWPLAETLNFFFLPPPFRIIYINTVYLGWSMVLSYLKHHDIDPKNFQFAKR